MRQVYGRAGLRVKAKASQHVVVLDCCNERRQAKVANGGGVVC